MIPLWARVIVPAVFLLGAYLWIDSRGYARGEAAAETRHLAEVAQMQEKLDQGAVEQQRLAADLESYKDAQRMLALEVEDEARNDPLAGGRVPTDDSVRRLKRRWQAAD